MTDQSLRRADELLTELVEQVETARALPMSSSCVLPRERMLDLLDELREVLPPEIDEARRVIANRDSLLHDAYAEATAVREKASAEAETMAANAESRAAQIVHDAEVRARALSGLERLGIAVDPARNAAARTTISPPGSPVAVLVVPADEEAEMARQAAAVVSRTRPSP